MAAQIVYDSARQGIFAFGFNSSSLISASTVRVAPRIGYAVAGPPVAYKDPGTGDYFVSLSFKNVGNIANFFTAFQKATLALQNYKSVDYVTGPDTPPGGLFTTTIRFPGSIRSGVKILSLSGTYFPGTGANISFNFSANLIVTLP